MPAHQITLGVPAYGYLSASWNDNLRTRDMPVAERDLAQTDDFVLGQGFPLDSRAVAPGQLGLRERSRRALEKRYVTVSSGWSTSEGQVMWHDLVSQGALTKGSNGKWIGAGGFERKWDTCSSTVRLRLMGSGLSVVRASAETAAVPQVHLVRPNHLVRRPGQHVAQGAICQAGRPERVQRLFRRWRLYGRRLAFDGRREVWSGSVVVA